MRHGPGPGWPPVSRGVLPLSARVRLRGQVVARPSVRSAQAVVRERTPAPARRAGPAREWRVTPPRARVPGVGMRARRSDAPQTRYWWRNADHPAPRSAPSRQIRPFGARAGRRAARGPAPHRSDWRSVCPERPRRGRPALRSYTDGGQPFPAFHRRADKTGSPFRRSSGRRRNPSESLRPGPGDDIRWRCRPAARRALDCATADRS